MFFKINTKERRHMFFAPALMMLYSASHSSATNFYGKHVMLKGIQPKYYAYKTNLNLLFFILPLFLMFPFDISNLGWQLVVIVALAGAIRTLNVVSFANALKK